MDSLIVKFENKLESKILLNFLKDRGFSNNKTILNEDQEDEVYLIIGFTNQKLFLTDIEDVVGNFYGDRIYTYATDKSVIYKTIFDYINPPIESDDGDEWSDEQHMIRIQLPVNSKENLNAREEIELFLLDYRVPLDKQYNLYKFKSYLWMMIDYNDKTYWFESHKEKTLSADMTFHYRNNRNELLRYLEEITGLPVEDGQIDERVDEAENQLDEFILDVVDLGYELKKDIKEGAGELIEDITENFKGLTKRTIKNLRDTDPVEVKNNIKDTVTKTKENISVFAKVLKRKIKKL